MYEFLNSTNANDYERFVAAHENGSFMQSLAWRNVKTNWEYEAVISRDEQRNIRGACLVLIKKMPFPKCSFLYAPRGPVCSYLDIEAIADIAEGIDALAKKHRAFAVLCDPPVTDSIQTDMLKIAGFSQREIHEEKSIQCRFNYVLNLEGKTLAEICAGFKSEYRNRINKAQRRGVWCEELCGESAINALGDFYDLMIQTGKRDGFPIRSMEYFTRFLRSLGENARMYMCFAEIDGKKIPLSGAIAVNFGGEVVTYAGQFLKTYRPIFNIAAAIFSARKR